MNILDELLTSVNALRTDVATLRAELAQQARPAEEDRIVGIADASAIVGESIDWIRDHIRQIPHSKPGAHLKFSTFELKAWNEQRFEAGKQPTAQEAAAKAMRGSPAKAGAPRRRETRRAVAPHRARIATL